MTEATEAGHAAAPPAEPKWHEFGKKRAFKRELQDREREGAFLQRLKMRGGDVEALGRFKAFIANQAKVPNSDLQKILKRKDFLQVLESCGIEKEKDYYVEIPKSRFATILERTNPAHAEEMIEMRKDLADRIRKGRFGDLFVKDGKYNSDIVDVIVITFSRLPGYEDEFFKFMVRSAVDAEAKGENKKGIELGQLAATLLIQQTFRLDTKDAPGESLIPLEVAKKVEILGNIGKRYAIDHIKDEFNKLGDLVEKDDKINASMVCEDALEDNESDLPYAEPENEKVKRIAKRIDDLKTKKEELEGKDIEHATNVRIKPALAKIEKKMAEKIKEVDDELDALKKEIKNTFKGADNVEYEDSMGASDTEIDEYEAEVGASEPYEERLCSLLLGMVEDVKNNKLLDYEEKNKQVGSEEAGYIKPLKLAFKNGLKKLDRIRFDEKTCLKYIDEQSLEFTELLELKEKMKADDKFMEEYKKVNGLICGKTDDEGIKEEGVVYYLEKYAANLEKILSDDIKRDIRKLEDSIPGYEPIDVVGLSEKGVIEEDRKHIKNAAVCLVWINKLLNEIQKTDVEDIKKIAKNESLSMREKVLALDRYDAALETRIKTNETRYSEIVSGLKLTAEEEKLLEQAIEKKSVFVLLDDRRPESLKLIELLGEKEVLGLLRTSFKVAADDIEHKKKKKREKTAKSLQNKIDGILYRYEKKRHAEIGGHSIRTLKYDNINKLETDLRVAVESERKLKPARKAYMLLVARAVHTNEEKRLDIEIATKTAPLMNEPPYLFVNDYLAASKNYLGGMIKRDQFQDSYERKLGLLKMYYLGDILLRSKSKIGQSVKEMVRTVQPWYWTEGTKSFPTMRRGGKFWLGYIGLGGLAALNLVALLSGQPARPPLNHRGNPVVELAKSAKWHAAYPGGWVHEFFTSKKASERLGGDQYKNPEPTKVVWDGKRFYFEIDGEKRDLGEMSMVKPGTLLDPHTPAIDWETDPYGYYKSAYFGNSKAEPSKDVLAEIDSNPELIRFLEEIGMGHKWIREEIERDEEIAEGMIESGWQEVSRDKKTGKVVLERWLLTRYDGEYVLNSEQTASLIDYLKGKEAKGDVDVTYEWLKDHMDELKNKNFVVSRNINRYMTTFELTTEEATWILSDTGYGKQAYDLLAELSSGKMFNEKSYQLDERTVGAAIKELYALKGRGDKYFSELGGMNEGEIIAHLITEGYIGDSTHRPLVERFGLTFANASWVSERPKLLELLYHLKAERVTDMDNNRYTIADANAFVDYLKKDKAVVEGNEINEDMLGYSLPGYATLGHLNKVSEKDYLGITQDDKWEWLNNHADIKGMLKELRSGLEYRQRIYYLSPLNLATDTLVQELMDEEYRTNKNSKEKKKITALQAKERLETYRKEGYILGKYNDYPPGIPVIPGACSKLEWMTYLGIQEPHASDIMNTPEIRDAFVDIYQSDDVLKVYNELYPKRESKTIKAIWSKNQQVVFQAVGEYIAKFNKDNVTGIECDNLTGQCKFQETEKEGKGKEKLKGQVIAMIKMMKEGDRLNDKITEQDYKEMEEQEAAEQPEEPAGPTVQVPQGPATVSPPAAPAKEETTEEEDKPAKVTKKKGGKKTGKKSSGSGAGGF